ncbi:MAG: sugar transferase [Bacteroidia bacterium]|jgi:lipopolysaccharide/colanic/teichoic acid biosynthesis glycosyltransferase|nr:sugar transferase [Bacteroidia bacterium]
MIRLLDIIFSFFGLLILLPFFILIAVCIKLSSAGSIFFIQQRVGKDNIDFRLIKFRTMKMDSYKKGLLTVGGRDPRITGIGYFLRKFKLDELPQLINVLFGDMSLVGPRPEVRKYVDLYTVEQKRVLIVRPGITDSASLEYFNENELLSKSSDPEKTYIGEIMPAKLQLNMKFINNPGISSYFGIIFRTIGKIFS